LYTRTDGDARGDAIGYFSGYYGPANDVPRLIGYLERSTLLSVNAGLFERQERLKVVVSSVQF